MSYQQSYEFQPYFQPQFQHQPKSNNIGIIIGVFVY
jgi:hypothetical protein